MFFDCVREASPSVGELLENVGDGGEPISSVFMDKGCVQAAARFGLRESNDQSAPPKPRLGYCAALICQALVAFGLVVSNKELLMSFSE